MTWGTPLFITVAIDEAPSNRRQRRRVSLSLFGRGQGHQEMTCRTLRCFSHAVSPISQTPNLWALQCVPDETCPNSAIANYLNIPDHAPLPPIGSDLELAQDASPTQLMHVGMCPIWAKCPSEDALGIPTSTGFNIHSYNPDNTQGPLEQAKNGFVPTALAIGLRESTASVPEAD